MEPEIYRRMAEVENKHWWFVGRREIIAAALKRVKTPSDARILELGCGTGGNLELLKKHGTVTALEPDQYAREYASTVHKVKVVEGFLPNKLPLQDEQYDLVAAFDVIEHLEKDADSITAISKLLTPGGYCVVTVPAYQFMWSAHDEKHHHKRRYVKGELVRMIKNSGLRIEYSSYFNSLLFPVALAHRLVAKLLHRQDTNDDQLPGSMVNELFKRIFGLEKMFIMKYRMPFGLSIMIIARKDD